MSKKNPPGSPVRFRFNRLEWLVVVLVIAACAVILAGGPKELTDLGTRLSGHLPQPRAALTGFADVRDGDTIVVEGVRIRLEAIDAFELHQTCNGMPCGVRARSLLQSLTSGGPVSCTDEGRDRYDRVLSYCRNARGVDINRAMVESGYAIAYLYYSRRYEGVQHDAQRRKAGAWATGFIEPYEYRRGY